MTSRRIRVLPNVVAENDKKGIIDCETLVDARDAVREMKRDEGMPKGGLEVRIPAGRHEVAEPLNLGPEDSGEPDAPVVWRGNPDGEVVLSGGRKLENFVPVQDDAAISRLPATARNHVLEVDLFEAGIEDLGHSTRTGERPELFVDGEAMPLAGWPNDGFTTVKDVSSTEPFDVRGTEGDRVGKIVYDGSRPEQWRQETDGYLHGYWFWDWSDSYERIDNIDVERSVIELEQPYHKYGYRPGQRYRAVNMLCELDTPGEWYIDRNAGKLYLWPLRAVEGSEVVLSVRKTLIEVSDVSHVRFEGLTLEGSREDAVSVAGGTDVSVRDCEIRNVGGNAISMRGGTGHRVSGCHIFNPGRGGVVMTGGDRATLTPGEHVADDNHIHHFSRVERTYTPAVKLGGVGNVARDNHIHHAPHNGIQVSGNDHLIEGNELHHLCQETGDVGAFYICARDWTQRGTVLRGNFFHHICGPGQGGARTVYLDDMTSGFTVKRNLFYRAAQALHVGGGRDNVFQENVIVDCEKAIHIDARATNWASFHVEPSETKPASGKTLPDKFRETPVDSASWRERYPELQGLLDDEPARPKGNVVRQNVILGEHWDDITDEARPHVELSENCVDDGWLRVCGSTFTSKADLDAWEVREGDPGIGGDPLRNDAPMTLVSKETWPLPLRIQYEANAEEPCDFSAFLGEDWQEGWLLQYGGQDNSVSRIVCAGEELLRTDATIETGRWETVRWRVFQDSINLSVNGSERFHLVLGSSQMDASCAPVGLFLHGPTSLRSATVEHYDPRLVVAAWLDWEDIPEAKFWEQLWEKTASEGSRFMPCCR